LGPETAHHAASESSPPGSSQRTPMTRLERHPLIDHYCRLGSVERCLFCGSLGASGTEHVLPKWAQRDFNIQGSLTIWAGEHSAEPARRKVARRPQLTITLDGRICETCNNGPLSQLEGSVRSILSPMMLKAEPTELDPAAQELLAAWGVKTVLLLELSFRQHYPNSRLVPGYVASEAEFAWLWRERRPPPRSLVWLGCWDCRSSTPMRYEPSVAPVPSNGASLKGHFTTFSVGFVVFQVFTVDFVAADHDGATLWNTSVPRSLEAALARIWPAPRRTVSWPGPMLPYDEWARLVTWDGVLRQGTDTSSS